MRLGKLARTVSLKPKELIEFLSNQGKESYTHANSKVSEEEVRFVLNHFGIKLPTEPENEIPNEEQKPILEVDHKLVSETSETQTEEIETNIIEPAVELLHVEHSKKVNDQNSVPEVELPDIEVIKAPKIELPGLKVLGKIDLPEKVKKDPEEISEPTTDESDDKNYTNKRRRNQRDPRGNKRQSRPFDADYNPVKAKREREQKKKEKERELLQKKVKQKKKDHYLDKVATQKASPKSKKRVNTPASYAQVVLENERNSSQQAKKGNFLVRLWRWLNTY